MRGIGHAALDVLRTDPDRTTAIGYGTGGTIALGLGRDGVNPPVDQTVLPGVGYHPQHAQRAWRDIVDLLAECLPATE